MAREAGAAPSIGSHGRCCADEEKLLLQDVLLPSSYPHTWHWCPIIKCTDATTATRSWSCVSSSTPWSSSISPMLTQSKSLSTLSSTGPLTRVCEVGDHTRSPKIRGLQILYMCSSSPWI